MAWSGTWITDQNATMPASELSAVHGAHEDLLSGSGGLDDGIDGHSERCASYTQICKPSG